MPKKIPEKPAVERRKTLRGPVHGVPARGPEHGAQAHRAPDRAQASGAEFRPKARDEVLELGAPGGCTMAMRCRMHASRFISPGPRMRRSSPCWVESSAPCGLRPRGLVAELVGPAHGIDTDNFRVLGVDYLGGRGGAPPRRRANGFRR